MHAGGAGVRASWTGSRPPRQTRRRAMKGKIGHGPMDQIQIFLVVSQFEFQQWVVSGYSLNPPE